MLNWPNTMFLNSSSDGLLPSINKEQSVSGSAESSDFVESSLFVSDWDVLTLSPNSQMLRWRSTYPFGYQRGLMFLNGAPSELKQKSMAAVYDMSGSVVGLTSNDQNNVIAVTSAEILRELFLATSTSGYVAQQKKSLAVIAASAANSPKIIISLNELAQTQSISFRAPLLDLIVNETDSEKRSILAKSYQQLGLTRLLPLSF